MIPKQAKKRQPDELVLATFRIPYAKWEKFQQAAIAAETTASATLLAFIEDYLTEAQTGIYANVTKSPEAPLESEVEPADSKTATELETPGFSKLNSQLKAEIQKQIEESVHLKINEFEPKINAIETEVSRLSQHLDRVEHTVDKLSKGKTAKASASEFIDVQAVPFDSELNQAHVESDQQLSQEYDPENLPGLSQTGLCTEFGINPNNINRHAIRRGLSTAEYLHQLTGWVFRNGKYYPPES